MAQYWLEPTCPICKKKVANPEHAKLDNGFWFHSSCHDRYRKGGYYKTFRNGRPVLEKYRR